MKVFQVINNNVISAIEEGTEVIIFGKGVGYKVKRGDDVDEEKISKKFVPDLERNRFTRPINEIDFGIISIVKDIMDYGLKRYQLVLRDSVFFILCDHLEMAVTRFKEGLTLPNPFVYDIKAYYENEYKTARIAVERLWKTYGVRIDDDEVCYIAIHLIEGENNAAFGQTKKALVLIDEILNIVESELNLTKADKETYHYNRFLLHVKYFANRYLTEQDISDVNGDVHIYAKDAFKKQVECVKKISNFLEQKYQKRLSDSEVVYLTIHLKNIEK